MRRKIDTVKSLIRSQPGLLQCPLCEAGLALTEPNSVACPQGHTFDLARTGYLNLLPSRKGDQKYTKALFEARSAVYQRGLYEGVVQPIAEAAAGWAKEQGAREIRILDLGCGEGSHLWNVASQIAGGSIEVLAVGVDIAKEGIQVAARNYPGPLWCVGDLAKAPFAPGQFHVLLNIFSPANYREFARLMAPEGLVIKVVPGERYLEEVRLALHGEGAEAGEGDAAFLFAQHFAEVSTVEVQYRAAVDANDLPALVEMTPLSWQASPERKEAFVQSGLEAVTIDVAVLIGRRPLA